MNAVKRQPEDAAENGHPGIIPSVARDCVKWNPEELQKPEIDPEFTELHVLERSAEAVRYQTARLEYWLSPSGTLRAWLKVCLRFAVAMTVPAVIMLPLSIVLQETVACAIYLQVLAYNLLQAVVSIIITLFVIRIAFGLWHHFISSSRRH